MGWEADLCSSAAVVACAPLAAFKDDERQVRSEADLRIARCLGRCCWPKLSSLNPSMDRDQMPMLAIQPGAGLTPQSGCPDGSAFQNMILSK